MKTQHVCVCVCVSGMYLAKIKDFAYLAKCLFRPIHPEAAVLNCVCFSFFQRDVDGGRNHLLCEGVSIMEL